MKGNKKSLIYLLTFTIIFALFIFILLRPSTESKAIKEINTCLNPDDVKATWYKYRTELLDDDAFCQAARNQLASFNLKQPEIADIKKWLPSKTNNLNVIIVPDLSYRIRDSKNNPDQIKNDTAIINAIWNNFKKNVRLKMNTKDRLLIDVTNETQANGEFRKFADSLSFQLSEHKNKSNRLYFTDAIQKKFSNNIDQLYKLASQQTTNSGADFVSYFSERLKRHLQKSTLDDNYRNILIILTDGYLEPSPKISISPNAAALRNYCATGYWNNPFPPQTIGITLPNVEVYLFEVNGRLGNKDCDVKGLKRWWTEWFKTMNIPNTDDDFFFTRQDGISFTEKDIENIFTHS